MSRPIIFGEIDGFEEGKWIKGRKEMMPSSFHRNWGQGIDGNGKVGASAIVLSGGYEDDEDYGDEIIYTGAGGNDPDTGKQTSDQNWEQTGNAGLLKSMDEGLPVRVIRGHNHNSKFSPDSGYVYSGLFSVVDAWEEVGKSDYKICRFRLIYCGHNYSRKEVNEIELDYSSKKSTRVQTTVLRIIRNSKIISDLKKLYNYNCQVCNISIKTKSGFYAEGAHIWPLGKPHNGQDKLSNLLCLCPNHHVMFDKGVFSINDDLNLIGNEDGKLYVHKNHKIDHECLIYHRKINLF